MMGVAIIFHFRHPPNQAPPPNEDRVKMLLTNGVFTFRRGRSISICNRYAAEGVSWGGGEMPPIP